MLLKQRSVDRDEPVCCSKSEAVMVNAGGQAIVGNVPLGIVARLVHI